MTPAEQLAAELRDTSARLARTFRAAKNGVEAIDVIDEARLVIDRVANRLDPLPLRDWAEPRGQVIPVEIKRARP